MELMLGAICRKTNLLALKYQSAALQQANSGNKKAKTGPLPFPAAATRSRYMAYSRPWLRQLGFYGRVHTKSYSQCLLDADIFLGYQFPAWLWSKSIDFELQIRIPSFIRMQNRVLVDSLWMVACRRGDIDRMRQHLADKSGSVGDRLSCSGQTPLMV